MIYNIFINVGAMKKVLFFITFLSMAAGVYGNQPLQLVFETSDGDNAALNAESVVMTVENDVLSVSNATQSKCFPLDKLIKMYFSYQSAGIEGIVTGRDCGPLKVYTIDGVSAGVFESFTEMRDRLNHGVYLVNQGSVTYKIKL